MTSSEGVSRGALLSFSGAANKYVAVSLAVLSTDFEGSTLVEDTLAVGGVTSMCKNGVHYIATSLLAAWRRPARDIERKLNLDDCSYL